MFRFCLLVALMFVYSGTSWAFLDVVKNLELVLVGDKFVEIEFDAVEQATGYTLVLGTQSVQGPEQSYNLPPIEMGVETRFRVENLQPDGEYFMRVFANSSPRYSFMRSINPLRCGSRSLYGTIKIRLGTLIKIAREKPIPILAYAPPD